MTSDNTKANSPFNFGIEIWSFRREFDNDLAIAQTPPFNGIDNYEKNVKQEYYKKIKKSVKTTLTHNQINIQILNKVKIDFNDDMGEWHVIYKASRDYKEQGPIHTLIYLYQVASKYLQLESKNKPYFQFLLEQDCKVIHEKIVRNCEADIIAQLKLSERSRKGGKLSSKKRQNPCAIIKNFIHKELNITKPSESFKYFADYIKSSDSEKQEHPLNKIKNSISLSYFRYKSGSESKQEIIFEDLSKSKQTISCSRKRWRKLRINKK